MHCTPVAPVGDIGSALEITGAPAVVGRLGFLLGRATTGIFLVVVRLFLPLPSTTPCRDVRSGFPAVGLAVFVLVAVARQVVLSGGVRF